jgi:predicted metal-dependent hydrolase
VIDGTVPSKLLEQESETPREYIERESHYVWGRRYFLNLAEDAQAPSVELNYRRMLLRVRPGTDEVRKQTVLEEWYRAQLRTAVPPLIAMREPLIGVKVERFFVRRMRTKWGSCNPVARSIRLNTDLAKKPRECLEYVVVHEMLHLLEPTHNARLVALMDRFMPTWRFCRDVLNRLPVRHENWEY